MSAYQLNSVYDLSPAKALAQSDETGVYDLSPAIALAQSDETGVYDLDHQKLIRE